MTRFRLLALIVLALAFPAAAQMMQVQRPQVAAPVIMVAPQASSNQLSIDPANDPDRARALIAKLRSEKRALRDQMAVTLSDLQAARSALDEITRPGGSAVMAQCVSADLSRRTDGGGEENCAASGYHCAPVEGTCRRQCTSSDQCAGGFVCDIGAARCVVPVPSDE